jgi:hypothetical protein
MFLKNFHIFIKKQAVLQQKYTVQVTTLADCDDITRFDGSGLLRELSEHLRNEVFFKDLHVRGRNDWISD